DNIGVYGIPGGDPGYIQGNVALDGGAGNVEEVLVTAGYATASPDVNGDYEITIIAGTYDVTATLAGYEDSVYPDVVVEEGVITDGIDLTLAWIPPFFYPPENLAVDEETGLFTWDEPAGGASGDILHHTGYDNNGIGTGAAVDFISAARFDDVELVDYYGSEITGVNIVIHSADFSYVAIQVYEGGSYGDPGTLVYDEEITGSVIVADWTNHVLSTPVPLVAGNEYWIGYDIHATFDHPAAVDAGPMVPDKGGWMYFNNAWATLPELGATLDFNWVITGVIGSGGDEIALAKRNSQEKPVIQQRRIPVFTEATFEAEFSRSVSRKQNQIIENSRELQGYNVYLNATMVDYTTETFWQFEDLENGVTYVAGVEAVYDEGTSEIEEITFTYTPPVSTGEILPLITELSGNFPNPFNP
ncbi:MAG: carboxypeptidase regulatory-like domain-containing protein, partial [Candidatus Delongbacteria bacterium]|nr:carboxypeptidase regulatory-like domain-containing protein [Candidatus Delongbacteria bacterium]